MKPAVDAPEFPEYLQWFHYCEGMVMPPVNTIVVQTVLLPPGSAQRGGARPGAAPSDAALAPVDTALAGRDYPHRDFSAADVMLGHAIFMANRLGCATDDMSNLKGYVQRIEARPAFQTAINM